MEHISSRILILTGITNTILCGLLILMQGAVELHRLVSSFPFHFGRLLLLCVLLILPGRVLWNYCTIQNRLIKRFELKRHGESPIRTTVDVLAAIMGISAPVVLSSNQVKSPFVFGRSSERVYLAIPDHWSGLKGDTQYISLLHELAHIRNLDVGFLTWGQVCLVDMPWLFLFSPLLVVLSNAMHYKYILPTLAVYFACSLILYVLLRYVVRKREGLADLTVALLIESGRVGAVIHRQQTDTIELHSGPGPQVQTGPLEKIHHWLWDKATFSRRAGVWGGGLRIFRFLFALHPARTERIRTVSSIRDTMQSTRLMLGDSLWAGVSVGLFAVIIGLGGYWFAADILGRQGMTDINLLPFWLYGLFAPIAVSFMVVFIVLPQWATLRQTCLDGRFVSSLLLKYAVVLAGACSMCLLILVGRATNPHVRFLFLISVIWCVFMTFLGVGCSVVAVFLWMVLRYFQASQIVELGKMIWSLAVFLILVSALIVASLMLMHYGMMFAGAGLAFSLVVGCVLCMQVLGKSRFSEMEQYLIFRVLNRSFLFEGKCYKPIIYWVNSFVWPTLFLFLTACVYLGIYLALSRILSDVDSSVCMAILLVACCMVVVLLGYRERAGVKEAKRHKVYRMCHSLEIMKSSFGRVIRQKISNVAGYYDVDLHGPQKRISNLTMQDAYEVSTLLRNGEAQDEISIRISKWVRQCQNQGGFGIWPGSSSRLSSTYQGLSILQNHRLFNQCHNDDHVVWIRALEQPNGCFKDPIGKRPLLTDTFYAVQSLRILKASPISHEADSLQHWCADVLNNQGIARDQPDIVYYSLGILEALEVTNEQTIEQVSKWLSSQLDALLLTNIGLNYERVHFTALTFGLLQSHSQVLLNEDRLTRLTERISTALEAELSNIPA